MAIGDSPQAGKKVSIKIMGSVDPSVKDAAIKAMKDQQAVLESALKKRELGLKKELVKKKAIITKKLNFEKQALANSYLIFKQTINKKNKAEKKALDKSLKQKIANINKKAKAEKSALNKNLQEKKAILECEFNEQTSNLNKQIAQRKQFLRKEVNQRKQAESEKRAVIKKTAQAWRESGKNLAIHAGIAFAATIKLSKGLLDSASKYEQYRVTLLAVTKSQKETNRLFQQALKYAPKSPFKVGDIVRASVQMKAFGVNVKQTLTASGNLAAAFNTDLYEATLGVSKALKGSAMGFRILRNQYGITTMELQKYGAMTVNGTRMILSQKGALEANRKALLALIKDKYGNAIKLQIDTVKTALSNLNDSIDRASASIGKEMIPTIKSWAEGLTKVVYAYKNLGDGTKKVLGQMAIWTPIILGGVAALGGLIYATAILVESYATLSWTMTNSVIPALIKTTAWIKTKAIAIHNLTVATKAGAVSWIGYSLAIASAAAIAYSFYHILGKINEEIKWQIENQRIMGWEVKKNIRNWKVVGDTLKKLSGIKPYENITQTDAIKTMDMLRLKTRRFTKALKEQIAEQKKWEKLMMEAWFEGTRKNAKERSENAKQAIKDIKEKIKLNEHYKKVIDAIRRPFAETKIENKEKIIALDKEILLLERKKELKGLIAKEDQRLYDLYIKRSKISKADTEEKAKTEEHDYLMKAKEQKESMREDEEKKDKETNDKKIENIKEWYKSKIDSIVMTRGVREFSDKQELAYLYTIRREKKLSADLERNLSQKIWNKKKKIREDEIKTNEKIRKQKKKDSDNVVKTAEKIAKDAKKKADKVIEETKKINDETKKITMTTLKWEAEQFKERIKKLREMGVKEIDIKKRVEAEKIKLTKDAVKKQKKETDKQKKELDDLKAKLDSLRASRQGGAASPIYGVEELGAASAAMFSRPSQIKPSVTTGGISGLTVAKPPDVTVQKDQWKGWKEGLKPVERPKIENKITVNITGMKGEDKTSGIKTEITGLGALKIIIPSSLIDTYAPEVEPIGTGGGAI